MARVGMSKPGRKPQKAPSAVAKAPAKKTVPAEKRQEAPIAKCAEKKVVSKEKKKTVKTALKPSNVRTSNFHTYIRRVLKSVSAPTPRKISSGCMEIVNDMVNDVYTRIVRDAKQLLARQGKKTLTDREIGSAARMILAGEVAKHAASEMAKAKMLYSESTTKST